MDGNASKMRHFFERCPREACRNDILFKSCNLSKEKKVMGNGCHVCLLPLPLLLLLLSLSLKEEEEE